MAVFPLVIQPLDIALVLIPMSAIRRAAVKVRNHVPVLIIWRLDVCSRKAIDAPTISRTLSSILLHPIMMTTEPLRIPTTYCQ